MPVHGGSNIKMLSSNLVEGRSHMLGKARWLMLAMLAVVSLEARPAVAVDYPTRPIEILVPYPGGAPMDLMSRFVADTAPKYLGQPVVVVNKPGAGGSLAAAEIISSKPDGYKLLNTTNLFFATTTKTQKIPFDPSYLAPLVNLIEYRGGICVRGDSPWKDFNDLLDYARKNPGKLRWGHSGRGIGEHIATLLIFRRAGVQTIEVPYKGTPEKVTALLGGHVDAIAQTYGIVQDHVKAGKIRYLIFLRGRGHTSAGEYGFPEVAKLTLYSGYFVHKDTPQEIKKILIEAFRKTYDDPVFQKQFEKLGEEPRFGGPEFVEETIRGAEEIGVPMLKELGLYVGK